VGLKRGLIAKIHAKMALIGWLRGLIAKIHAKMSKK
jgi:hypothetical protein